MSQFISGYMLENPSIRPVLALAVKVWAVTIRPVRKTSRKGRSAADWVVGFVDWRKDASPSASCRAARLVATATVATRPATRLSHSFMVAQGGREATRCLEELQVSSSGSGGCSCNRRHDNHREDLWPVRRSSRRVLGRSCRPTRYPASSREGTLMEQFANPRMHDRISKGKELLRVLRRGADESIASRGVALSLNPREAILWICRHSSDAVPSAQRDAIDLQVRVAVGRRTRRASHTAFRELSHAG